MRERLLAQPHHVHGETVGRLQVRAVRIHRSEDVATGDIYFVIEGDGHGLTGDGGDRDRRRR